MQPLELLKQQKFSPLQTYESLQEFILTCFQEVNAPLNLTNASHAISVGLCREYQTEMPRYLSKPNIDHTVAETEPDFMPKSVYLLLLYLTRFPAGKNLSQEIVLMNRFVEHILTGKSGVLDYFE